MLFSSVEASIDVRVEGLGSCSPQDSGKAIFFDQSLNFLDSSQQPKMRKKTCCICQTTNGIHSVLQHEVPQIRVFQIIGWSRAKQCWM